MIVSYGFQQMYPLNNQKIKTEGPTIIPIRSDRHDGSDAKSHFFDIGNSEF